MKIAEIVSIISVLISSLALICNLWWTRKTFENQKEKDELEFEKSVFLTNQKMLEEYIVVLTFIVDRYKKNIEEAEFDQSNEEYVKQDSVEKYQECDPVLVNEVNHYFTGISYSDITDILSKIDSYKDNYFLYELKQLVEHIEMENYSDEQNLVIVLREESTGEEVGYSIDSNDKAVGNDYYKDVNKTLLGFSLRKLEEIQEVFQKFSSVGLNITGKNERSK